ncbi:MAG: uncharacterized protein H6Q91_2445 [Deltaproteobacteria bacterium]|nr:uncharacterized protein [Deltaproteobacteria bacterium]
MPSETLSPSLTWGRVAVGTFLVVALVAFRKVPVPWGVRVRVVVVAFALIAAGLAYLWFRPNRAEIEARLQIEHWDVVADGRHNSNTDMILWRGDFLLVHDARPYHFGSPDARLVVRRSRDGRHWEELARLAVRGKDIRDPKFAVIGGKLFLYALPNSGKMATPEGTVVATSDDAVQWTPFEPVEPAGWLFWRPKSNDGGKTWYVPAYWHAHGKSILLRSTDGRVWQQVSVIHEGDGSDETDIEFLPDGRLLATARLEITSDTVLGNYDGQTAIAVAAPPFTRWTTQRSRLTRLDGPNLFALAGTTYAIARYQPHPNGFLTRMGGILSRKRTALYRVEPDRLVRLSDLPSSSDTSYAGVVVRDGALWVDYYTSRIDRDWPWLVGMLWRSEIRMARIPLDAVEALSKATP